MKQQQQPFERTNTGAINATNISDLQEYKYKRDAALRRDKELQSITRDIEEIRLILSGVVDIMEEKGLINGKE